MKKNLFRFLISSILYYLFLQVSQAANTTQAINTTQQPQAANSTQLLQTTNTTQLPQADNTSYIDGVPQAANASLQALIAEESLRETRYHHYLWHNMRDNWNNFTADIQQQFRDLGWEPPRPALTYFPNGTTVAITDNGSGEDFLYMHRQMIAKARSIAPDIVTGWKTIPAPGDAEYPVPPAYTIPNATATTASTTTQKTDDFYNQNIKPLEDTFTDPVELRKMTLGQLGSRLEFTVHNWMHMRFSNVSDYGYRLSYRGTIPFIDPKWDDPQYSWLGDFYASQVDPVFWKLHGWVDDRVEAWREANNLTNITWNGTWVGGPMSSLSSVLILNSTNTTSNGTSTQPSNTSSTNTTSLRVLASEAENEKMSMKMDHEEGGHGREAGAGRHDIMEKVMQILWKTGRERTFADPVIVEDFVPEEKKWKPENSVEKKLAKRWKSEKSKTN